jgi:hypothetical protein
MLNAFIKAISLLVTAVYGLAAVASETVELDAAAMRNLVERSYQYVAMFNVNNKMALDESSPSSTGGYNRVYANTQLLDHTNKFIARPNNDTLYVIAMLDVTEQPILLQLPAFDSVYVSLMVTAYDHYVTIPLSTGLGDLEEPTMVLFHSERSPDYDGAPVEGVDKIIETTGDFVSAVLRVMPHVAEPERLAANLAAMSSVDLVPLSEFRNRADDSMEFLPWDSPAGGERHLGLKKDLARFPAFGSDLEIYEDRFLEVMQFVVNHTTFDPEDALDAAFLEALAPLGVLPGKTYYAEAVAKIDGRALRSKAQEVAQWAISKVLDKEYAAANLEKVFRTKGNMDLELLVIQSVMGPIGQPATEALYPTILTDDGSPMNALYDYEIVMPADALPPAKAFWSATLYDSEDGLFIPNDQFKYSVGENAGFKLDEEGGIRIVVAAEKPEGVPDENWLPINRGDYDIDLTMRLYLPDLAAYPSWSPPVARKLK